MEEVASLPSFDDLSRHVRARLYLHHQVDPEQTPLTQSVVMRSGRGSGFRRSEGDILAARRGPEWQSG